MRPALTIPAALTFSALSLGSMRCSSTTAPTDAARADVADVRDGSVDVADAARDASTDTCPDPFECYSSLLADDAGGASLVYVRRDGGTSDVPCPPVPDGCLVV